MFTKGNYAILAILAVSASALFAITSAQNADKIDKLFTIVEAKCGGQVIEVPEKINSSTIKCVQKAKEEWATTGKKGAMPLPRLACIGVCIFQEIGLLDDKAQPTDNEELLKDFLKLIPERLRKNALESFQTCIKNNSRKLQLKKDDCSSYAMMMLCVKNAGDKICKM